MKSNALTVRCLYFLVGIILLLVDSRSAFFYFTILPLHYFLLKESIRSGYYSFFLLFMLLFISMGINSVTFFLFEKDYARSGFKAIGNFDFSILMYIESYVYVLVFSLALFLVMSFVSNSIRGKTLDSFFLIVSIDDNEGLKGMRKANSLLSILCFLSSILTIVMYNKQLGIRGMLQTPLPYHLTGFLYYFREIIISCAVVFLYIRSPRKNVAIVPIAVYLFLVSFTSVSRMLVGFIAIPIIFESFASNHKLRSISVLLYYFVLFVWMTKARDYLYQYETVHYSVKELIVLSVSNSTLDVINRIIYLINEISGRLYGGQSIVLSSQFHITSFSDILGYYVGKNPALIVPNMMSVMFGMQPVEGMGFGVSIGFIGFMVLLSDGHIIYSFLQGILVAFLLLLLEMPSRVIAKSYCSFTKRLVLIAITSLTVFVFWLGMGMVYYFTFLSLLIIFSVNWKKINILL